MAHIFKNPTSDTKGIIVFTHKEMQWFFPGKNKVKLIKLYVRNFSLRQGLELLINLIIPNRIRKNYNKISRHYFIGVHYGGYASSIPLYENCDFLMTPQQIDTKNYSILRIPLASRNFTSKIFQNRNQTRYWDILCISRMIKIKNLNYFLKSIRKIFDKGYNYKVLMIVPENKKIDSKRFYTNLMDDYYSLFSFKERQNFSIILLSSNIGFPGLSSEVMSHFYNSSKIFSLFSIAEGSSKVISEALLCGLPVVVKENLEGGGRDFLSKDNSILFSSFENAHESLIKAVENFNLFNIENETLCQNLSEEFSVEKLKEYFKKLFEENGQTFDGKLINTDRLNFRIPAHLNENIPWTRDRFSTADIFSHIQLKIFMKNLDFNTYQESS